MTVRSLRRVLTFQPLCAITLPLVIVICAGAFWILPQVRSDIEIRQQQLAKAIGMQVEGYLHTGVAMVKSAAIFYHPDRLHARELDALLSVSDSLSSLYLVGNDGIVTDVALRQWREPQRQNLIGLDLSANPLFRELVRSGKPRWSKTFLSVVHGGLVAAFGVRSDEFTLIGEVDLELLTDFLNQISSESELLILVVDRGGQVIADNRGVYTAQQLNIGNLELVQQALEQGGARTGKLHFTGQQMTGSITEIPSVGWQLLVAQSDQGLYHTVFEVFFFSLGGVAAALLAGLLLSSMVARRLALRFAELNRHAQEIAAGEPAGDWPSASIAEFQQLSDNLQQMAGRLQDSELLYRTLFERLPDGVVLWNGDTLTPLEFNSAAHQQLGYSRQEFARLRVPDIEARLNEAEIARTTETLHREGFVSVETEHWTKSRERLLMAVTLQLIELAGEKHVLAIHRDITEHKRAEENRLELEKQLLHVQKLESLGVLAGGIAHDFNNILLAITGNADMALRRLSKGGSPVEHIGRIKQAADKAADLARQMLAYSGKGKFKVELLELNRLLQEMLEMLEVSISKKAQLQLELAEGLPLVEADSTQLRQVVMNLVINASEAIGEQQGVISVRTIPGAQLPDAVRKLLYGEPLVAENCVCLEVTDDGCGMDRETLERLFDPFFSTKFAGRGLGMSAVQGIVRGHHGVIRVESRPGVGTSFRIFLPASDQQRTLPTEAQGKQLWQGQGRILLVDDEETVRSVASEMLEELGFEVVTAGDGVEGLEHYRADGHFDLVILDLTMPRMDGEQCFAELRKLAPDLRVIVSSGYSEQEHARKLMAQGLVGFIQKPYSLNGLRQTIQKALATG